ncbi:hypothetical protein CEXT_146041 [Caerostris extrusa]|uniref:Uncharacterized protein n=1 Tax=Caerostris extrusa TaxID=172846 RepID=A0AAV4PDK1_CAEEX|nr:hypothetical protein CEXT_146041 [Caerostris extrusa]
MVDKMNYIERRFYNHSDDCDYEPHKGDFKRDIRVKEFLRVEIGKNTTQWKEVEEKFKNFPHKKRRKDV